MISDLAKLHELADAGDAEAQFKLGEMYYCGLGVPRDNAKAAEWWRLSASPASASSCNAAEQGDNDAQYNLGWMYSKGQGVPQDYAEAAKWYRLAAEQGNADAQNDLKFMMNYKKQKKNILSELNALKTAHDAVVDAAYGELSSTFADAIWLCDEKELNDAKIAFAAACDAIEAELKTLTGEYR